VPRWKCRRSGSSGLDAYKKAMDCLKAGDVVILATPRAFVGRTSVRHREGPQFMEKPLTSDGPTSRAHVALGEQASKKNRKVAWPDVAHSRSLARRPRHPRRADRRDCAAARLRMNGRSARSDRAQAGRISDLLYKFSVSTAYCGRAAATQDFYIHNRPHGRMKNAWR